jgi:hypothetical protein
LKFQTPNTNEPQNFKHQHRSHAAAGLNGGDQLLNLQSKRGPLRTASPTSGSALTLSKGVRLVLPAAMAASRQNLLLLFTSERRGEGSGSEVAPAFGALS